jgi:four helix bundle protein
MQDFRKLRVWHSAQNLAVAIYAATEGFPRTETYGLVSQMRRAAISVSSNIAEGCGRDSDAEFTRFLHFSLGSTSELLSQVYLAQRLDLLTAGEADELIALGNSTKRQLIRLRQRSNLRSEA